MCLHSLFIRKRRIVLLKKISVKYININILMERFLEMSFKMETFSLDLTFYGIADVIPFTLLRFRGINRIDKSAFCRCV